MRFKSSVLALSCRRTLLGQEENEEEAVLTLLRKKMGLKLKIKGLSLGSLVAHRSGSFSALINQEE